MQCMGEPGRSGLQDRCHLATNVHGDATLPTPVTARRRSFLVLVLTLAAAVAAAAPAAALDRATLARKLSRETRHLGAYSGAYVFDLTTGKRLFSRRPDVALAPASNEKLFTTAAALLLLGPDATLTTTLRAAPGTTVEPTGVVRGDLYLVGGGDPSLNDAALTTLVRQLIDDHGVNEIVGGVIGDESLFDSLRGGPRTLFQRDGSMGGLLGALTWSHGRSGLGGPAQLAATRLQELLKAARVKMGRRPRTGKLATQAQSTGGEPADQTLAWVSSPPLSRLVKITNQPSDNFYAEMLVKGLGARFGGAGTTTAGIDVVEAKMAELGIRPTLVDGSGLSRADRASARQVVRLLRAMRATPVAQVFDESLARPGGWGTLERRMLGTAAVGRCRGKTGTLIGVSALSGYCTSRGGHLVAFSFLSNGVCTPCVKRVEDRMVPVIARFDGP
jgi:serine-type D-Ala-D-Ala carboxypeptidase/endopeptidase (penicillin-binding protein 4)